MSGLIANEWLKIYSRGLTRILLILVLAVAAGTTIFGEMSLTPPGDWQADTAELVQKYEERLKLSELAATLRADTENKLQIAEYRLENNIAPTPPNPWSALLTYSGLVEMVIIFVIIIAAAMVAEEYSTGTMKLLLIRPHSRARVLFAKYTAVSLFAILMLGLLFISNYTANALLYGAGGGTLTDLFLNDSGEVVELSVMTQALKMYSLSLFPVMLYATLAFAVSTLLRNSALAVGVSLCLMIVGNSMIEATAKMEWLKYLPFANSDISLYIFHLPARPEMTIGFSIAVLSGYMAILLLISWISFRERDVSI